MSWSEVIQIEEALNTVAFEGVPLGKIISPFLSNYHWIGIKDATFFSDVRTRVNILRYTRQRRDYESGDMHKLFRNKIIFSIAYNSERLTGFFKLLPKYLGAENCIYLGKNLNAEKIDDVKCVGFPKHLNAPVWRKWHTGFKNDKKKLRIYLSGSGTCIIFRNRL